MDPECNSRSGKNSRYRLRAIWAIGTGKTATTEQAEEVCKGIRACIAEIYDDATAAAIRIQYGGSVNAKTAPELFAQENIDGGLVGGASLKPDFGKIVKLQIRSILKRGLRPLFLYLLIEKIRKTLPDTDNTANKKAASDHSQREFFLIFRVRIGFFSEAFFCMFVPFVRLGNVFHNVLNLAVENGTQPVYGINFNIFIFRSLSRSERVI